MNHASIESLETDDSYFDKYRVSQDFESDSDIEKDTDGQNFHNNTSSNNIDNNVNNISYKSKKENYNNNNDINDNNDAANDTMVHCDLFKQIQCMCCMN